MNITSIYYTRGSCKKELGDIEGAINDYSEYIDKEPNYPQMYVLRAELFAQSKQYQLVIDDLTKAIELEQKDGRESIFTNRSVAKYMLGDVEGMFEDLLRALSIDPTYKPALLKLQSQKINLKKLEEEKGFNKTIKDLIIRFSLHKKLINDLDLDLDL